MLWIRSQVGAAAQGRPSDDRSGLRSPASTMREWNSLLVCSLLVDASTAGGVDADCCTLNLRAIGINANPIGAPDGSRQREMPENAMPKHRDAGQDACDAVLASKLDIPFNQGRDVIEPKDFFYFPAFKGRPFNFPTGKLSVRWIVGDKIKFLPYSAGLFNVL